MHPIRSSTARSLAITSAILLTALIAMSSTAWAAPSVLTASPPTWDYGNADIHNGGPSQAFTFTNNTPGLVTVNGVGVVGTDAGAFQVNSNGCMFNILGTGG